MRINYCPGCGSDRFYLTTEKQVYWCSKCQQFCKIIRNKPVELSEELHEDLGLFELCERLFADDPADGPYQKGGEKL